MVFVLKKSLIGVDGIVSRLFLRTNLAKKFHFTGLAYDLYPDGKLEYYGCIKDGFRHGMNVWFYPNGNIENINPQDCGAADGIQKKYYENGALKSQAYYVLGARVTYIEYDEAGHIIDEKLEPTEGDFERAKKWGVDLSKRDMTLK